MGMIPSIVAAQTVMRKEEERKRKGNPMSTGAGIGGKPRTGEPKTERERAATHFGVKATEVTPEMIQQLPPKGSGLARSDIEALAEAVAEKMKEDTSLLMIHILEHQATGAGRVIDTARARTTPCKCFSFEEEEYCWSPGVLGLMSSKKNPEQIASFCVVGKEPAGAGATKRFRELKSAIGEAHEKWEEKGSNLKEWWSTVGEKLEEKGIEI